MRPEMLALSGINKNVRPLTKDQIADLEFSLLRRHISLLQRYDENQKIVRKHAEKKHNRLE